ncbi:esterase FE4 isoform X2 [Agrilus planipennis]|uniref:Esterase FE4 isoform X2 n=1 Tax=Agrilus planipennis TaxID=224129 RepID=A0A1W4WCN8_AGRPL|nr:esterase FE4 isoform X2 [Agrilus planipennis]XP_018321740.1 esterase FE4 isoform X2 [Agrilus planipennis]
MRRSFILLFSVYVCCVLFVNGEAKNLPLTSTKLGVIKGNYLESRLKRTIYAYRGIRYAEAPVGNLRFQPPVPVKSWDTIYDATKDGAACPQPGFQPTSEDCLFLNVYTTVSPENIQQDNVTRPVIVYIHAGGFYSVTGRSDWAGPEYMLDQDVVFVTLNYRLGALGFISTGDKFAPGNLGLKDQVLALKWVKDNVIYFGGDPNCVTLYGYSMGSASISLHLISPMSRGLFHRAILSSGSEYGNWPIPRHQFNLAQKQARLVGCPDDSSQNIISCLKNISAESLGNSFFGFKDYVCWSRGSRVE